MDEQAAPLDLRTAEAALERGDYGQCLAFLTPLAESRPLPDPEGARVRFLMITAWMGRGDDEKAINTCRVLSRSQDPDLRQQAKQLLTILESPSLARPERWSMRLPDLEMSATGSASPVVASRRRSRRPKPPPPPPTGPTKSPTIGFAALVAAVLLGLTLLLSGCMRVEADLSTHGADRLQLTWQIQNDSGQLLPWQQRFESRLKRDLPAWSIRHPRPGSELISSEILSAEELQHAMDDLVRIVSETTGLPLPVPGIDLKEQNFLIGIRQNLSVSLEPDSALKIPGLSLSLSLDHGESRALNEGSEGTRLELRHWRWSRLGLGSLAVLALLLLSAALQIKRRQLGFGFPELPS
ncbi:DUF3153 domain-containing protein [Synechococcus sp. CC9616]|uniref:DUF3153 domain-containing protein n=1 Tax=Synechococcus sp. CC9616 TaxID=110663 RepID=UPI00048D4482|nr:DUF3153 domain-containing protein [Synechococcus sp. CC9616]